MRHLSSRGSANACRFLLLLCLVLFAGSPGFAAISSATVWEVRASGAADTNGGGFVAGSGGTDRSQQNAAQVAVGGGTVTSTITTTVETFTGGTYTVLAGDVGNIVQFISGTNVTAGFYQITSVSAGLNGTWTLDRTPLSSGTTTNAVANMGGALATLSKLAGAMVAQNKAYCTGAFSLSTGVTFSQTIGGSPTGAVTPTRLIGYGVTRGDAVHATATLTAGITGLTLSGQGVLIEQFDIDCASQATSIGILVSATFNEIRNCKVANFTSMGISITAGTQTVADCELTGGTAAATQALKTTATVLFLTRCFIHDNACAGVTTVTLATITGCLIANNSGGSSDGIQVNGYTTVLNNTIHNNGRHGINNTSTSVAGNNWRNNILSNNGGFGIVGALTTAGPAAPDYDGNAYFSNTSGTRSFMDSVAGLYAVSPYTNILDVLLSVSPYVGPTTGTTANFALNDTPGGGQACRRAGTPGTWAGNTGTTSYLDMGAVQTRSNIRIPRAAPRPKKKAVH